VLDKLAIERHGNEAEAAARTVIEQAEAALRGRRGDIPQKFITQLYARAVPEDVTRYGAADIAMWLNAPSIISRSASRMLPRSAAKRSRSRCRASAKQ